MRHAAAAALLLLTACGGSGGSEPVGPVPEPDPVPDPEPDGTAIVFSGDVRQAQPVTRAALSDGDGPTSFKVWGFKNDTYDAGTGAYGGNQTVMDGYNVVFESGSGATGWEYVGRGDAGRQQTVKYWDYGTRAYRYLAYAPATASGVTVTRGGTPLTATMALTGLDANNPDAAPYVSELWFSNGNAVLYPDRLFGKTITMKFFKPFARVRFYFTFSASVTQYGREALSAIRFAPGDGSKIAFKGNLTLSYPINGTSTELASSTTVAAGAAFPDVADALVTDYTTEHPHWYTVLPTATQGYYRLTLKVFNEERTAEVPADMMVWKPGYEYTYVFKIQEDGGVTLDLLEMAIHDWSEGTPRNHNFYNW
ncbi:MAG: fimbrillin family protein [Muribaculaceae bacterium]|nr:fimbrillin family protein [Muribaculaceae bacterium]